MKGKIAILMASLVLIPIASNVAVNYEERGVIIDTHHEEISPTSQDYSHTVLVELGSTTYCPYCPGASEIMHTLFASQPSPFFYYMTLVYDKSDAAMKRGRELNDFYIPMLYVDGGYKVVDDRNEASYGSAIEEASNREVHDIAMEINAEWNGNNIAISLSITNEGSSSYLGHLRICIVEINSRWIDHSGKHYNYTLMDYALNKYVWLKGGETKNIEVEWSNNYEMQQGNTMVLAYIAHWLPKIQKNPWDDPKPTRFLAQFVDETCAIEI